jgi:guanylate kinase
VHGHGYGTPRRFVEEAIERGKIVLLNIDVQGGLAIKAGHPDGVYIFVYPPSLASLEARLTAAARTMPPRSRAGWPMRRARCAAGASMTTLS